MKIAGPGNTDSTSLSQDTIKSTTLTLTVPLGDLKELKSEILNGGYSTVIKPGLIISECTSRSEIEEKFSSDNGKLSEIVLNSACTPGYTVDINVFCKHEGSSSKTKCYTGRLITYNQLSSFSKLDIFTNLTKIDPDFAGPGELSVPGEITNKQIVLEIAGVFKPKTTVEEHGNEIINTENQNQNQNQNQDQDQNQSQETSTSNSQDLPPANLTLDSFINPACLVQRLYLNFSAQVCKSQPLREVPGFSIDCSYFTDSNLYPATSRFQSVTINSTTYYPRSVSDLTVLLSKVDSNLTINFLALTEFYRSTGRNFECKWTKK
jgi:hypothetical protein